MKTFKIILNKIINFFKSLFKSKPKEDIKNDEPIEPKIKRLTYTKRTDN
jgi:hypothetical protein